MFTTPWKVPERIALFGTSADPPHLGHQSILLWLAQEFDRVLVWAADNPYKEKQSPISDRAQMLRLLIETLPTEGTGPLGDVEVNQQLSDRFSIHSIARARQLFPEARFTFVVGADLLAQLPKWYQAKEIFSQVDILVFPRPGYVIEGDALSKLRQMATVHIAQPPYQYDISSSDFRQTRCMETLIETEKFAKESTNLDAQVSNPEESDSKLSSPDSLHPNDIIPPVIRDYIAKHDLYPCLQSTPHPQPFPKETTKREKVSTHW